MNNLIAIFVGGGIGSLLRYGISMLFTIHPNSFPKSTFIANMIACLILGLILGSLIGQDKSSASYLFLATGVCGGFSTFSTFSAEAYTLIQNGNYTLALVYATLSLAIGVAAIVLGFWMGSKLLNS